MAKLLAQKITRQYLIKKFRLWVLLQTCLVGSIASAFDHTHSKWNSVVKKYVQTQGPATKVNYFELQKNRTDLDLYLKEVQEVKKSEYESWNETQKLAFLFNSYNALTLDLVSMHTSREKPLKSIKDIGSLFRNTWKIKFFTFLGESSNLDRIEQDLARPQFDEPRMHFAFNCASVGCPNLGTEAFTPEKLDLQLDLAARNFLNDPSRNLLSRDKNTLELSQIFNWYGEDFEKSKKFKSLKNFLSVHMQLPEGITKQVATGKIKFKFLEYDWNLNSLQ